MDKITSIEYSILDIELKEKLGIPPIQDIIEIIESKDEKGWIIKTNSINRHMEV